MKYLTIPVTAFAQNCSIVWCEETLACAIIDPGGDIDKLIAAIDKHQLKPEAIYLTHTHIDHVGGTPDLAAHYEIPVIGPHKEDEFWLDLLPKQSEMFNFPACEIFKPQQWLEQGDLITLGKETFEVRFTPGHTPGHIVFVNKNANVVFVGDVIFQGSVGRTDFPRGDHQTLMDAIKNQLWTLNDATTIVPGHGSETTIGHEKKHNPFVR